MVMVILVTKERVCLVSIVTVTLERYGLTLSLVTLCTLSSIVQQDYGQSTDRLCLEMIEKC